MFLFTHLLLIICRLEDLWKRFEAPNDANRWDNPLFRVKNSSATTSTSTANQQTAMATSTSEALPESVIQPKSLKSSWKPKKKKTDADSVSAEPVDTNIATTVTVAADTPSILSISGTAVTYADDLCTFVELSEVFSPMTDYLLHANLPLPNSSTVPTAHAQADLLYELDRTSQKITQTILSHQAEALEGTPLKFSEFDRVLTLNRRISPGELQRYRSQFVKVHSQHPPSTSLAVGVSFIEYLAIHL